MAGQGKAHGCLAAGSFSVGNKEEERKRNEEKEGKKGGGFIGGKNYYNIVIPFKRNAKKETCVSMKSKLRLGQNELDAEKNPRPGG